MLPIQKLKSEGHVEIRRAVSIDHVNLLRVIARRTQLDWADEDPSRGCLGSADQYTGRMYAQVPLILATVLTTLLQRYYRTFFGNEMMTWFFLKTRGGTPDQPIHRNFSLTRAHINPMDVSSIPGCFIVATMNDTVVNGFGWNHQVAFSSNKAEIKLHMGDIMFFRGDFIHSLVGYTYNNLCVYAFMGPLPFGNPWRQTRLIPLFEDNARDTNNLHCYVWGCNHEASSRRGLQRHVRETHHFLFNDVTWRHHGDSVHVVEDNNDQIGGEIAEFSLAFFIHPLNGMVGGPDVEGELESLVATDSDTELESAGEDSSSV